MSTASLLGAALVVALWCRSGWRSDALAYFTPGGAVQAVASHRGTITVFASTLRVRPRAGNAFDRESIDPCFFDGVVQWVPAAGRTQIHLAGFALWSGKIPGNTPGEFACLRVPNWFLIALFAVAPARAFLHADRRIRRLIRGLCPECGYDLREATERCPECGTPLSAPDRGARP